MYVSPHDYSIDLHVQTAKRDWIRVFYNFYAVLMVLLTTSSFYYLFSAKHDAVAAGTASSNKLYLGLWFLLFAMTGLGLLMTLYRQGLSRSLLLAIPIIAWVIFSFSWSVSGGRTLYFGVMWLMLVMMAYVVAENISPRRFLTILTSIFAVLLVLSLLGFALFPEQTSLARYGGGWLVDTEMNGVFAHKSDAGYYFALLILLLVSARDIGLGWSWVTRYLLIGVAFLGIILANSATALMSALSMMFFYNFIPRQKYSNGVLVAFGIGLLLFALSVPYMDIGQFAEMIGRDRGMTGRDEIWLHGSEFISQSPAVGFGYYGFFDQNVFSPVWKLWAQFDYFLTPHFHNSGMDIVISLGIVGLLLYMLTLFQGFMVLYNKTVMFSVRLVAFLILLMFIMTSAFDFTLMKHNHFSTFFMFYMFFLSYKQYPTEKTTQDFSDRRNMGYWTEEA